MTENPQIAFQERIKAYALESGFNENEIHECMDHFMRFAQIVVWGAEVELNKRYQAGPLEQTVCLIDASRDLEAKFMHGGSPSEEYKAYLES